ncbi:hypothetical protein HDR58_03360 [bacterium]|nr:hypothetical protein [bacterium]
MLADTRRVLEAAVRRLNAGSIIADPEGAYWEIMRYMNEHESEVSPFDTWRDIKSCARHGIRAVFGKGVPISETLRVTMRGKDSIQRNEIAWPWLSFLERHPWRLADAVTGGEMCEGPAFGDPYINPDEAEGCIRYRWRYACKVKAAGKRRRICWENRNADAECGPGRGDIDGLLDGWAENIRERIMKLRMAEQEV